MPIKLKPAPKCGINHSSRNGVYVKCIGDRAQMIAVGCYSGDLSEYIHLLDGYSFDGIAFLRAVEVKPGQEQLHGRYVSIMLKREQEGTRP